jgi:hypothetical protein
VDVTAVEFERRRGLRRWLDGSASLSGRAALFLALSTFLCGCVMAGLVFVGVWRHAATEQAQAQSARQSDRRQLLAGRHALVEARHTLAALKAQLARDHRMIVQTQGRAVRAASALARATNANQALGVSLSPSLQELIQASATLASQMDTMQSELGALETYVLRPGAAGLDPGYLATQVHYLVRSAAATSSSAVELARHTHEAQSILSTGTQSASR